jgi:hypothetical protein
MCGQTFMTPANSMLSKLIVAAVVACATSFGAVAQEAAWRVSKASGDAWITTAGAQPVALSNSAVVKAGDTVRTGANGRVLLVRGSESILVGADSVVGLPAASSPGLSTTIVQQAGSIVLDVEKRNVQHFEVATPYLAAVVKGTQFRVTVDGAGSRVDVLAGRVQVADYKSGQQALVDPGQTAQVSGQGASGLSLSGTGTLHPIVQGAPRSSPVMPMIAPREDNAASQRAENEQKTRVAADERPAQRVPAQPSADADWRSWGSDTIAWAKRVVGLDGRRRQDDTVMAMFAIPGAIGLSAAFAAGLVSRRRKRK